MSNNYLGEFTSIGAVWSKYPEGGKPNDFLTVNGVRYTWSVQLNSWITPNKMYERGWGADNVNGDLYIENDLRVGGTVYANNIRHPYKGLFGSLEQLQRYYPNPKPGDFADVGYTSPSTRYACEVKHEWTDTGQEGVDPSVILPPELSDMELISRWGYVDDDARLTVDFSQRKVSWGESSVHFGKLKKVDIQQGEHLAQSSMSSSEKVGYLVFDKVEKIFNYYTPSTVPPTTDDIVLIAVFIDKKVSFSTSLIFDADGNGISPLQIVNDTIGTPEDEANAAGTIFSRIAFLANEIGERDEAPDIVGKIFGRLNYLTPISRKTFNLTLIESLSESSNVEEVMTAFIPENFTTPLVPDTGDYLLGKVNSVSRITQKAVVQNVSYSSDLTQRIQIAYNVGYGVTVVTINSKWQFISKVRLGLPNFEAEGDVENAQLSDFGGVSINPKSVAKNISTVDGGNVEAKLSDLDNRVSIQKADVDAARDEAIKKINDEVLSFNEGVTPEMLSPATVDLINASGGGTIINQPDDEDLKKETTQGGTEVMKFADKAYAPEQHSGLARKYLRKNISDSANVFTQEMVNNKNTIYHIQYDYDLKSATINIPTGCTLKFEGGSLSNGTIVGASDGSVKIIADEYTIFKNCNVSKIGTYRYYALWFGEIGTDVDSSIAIQKACDCAQKSEFLLGAIKHEVVLPSFAFRMDSMVEVSGSITITGQRAGHSPFTKYIRAGVAGMTLFRVTGHTNVTFKHLSIYPDGDVTTAADNNSNNPIVRNYTAFDVFQAEYPTIEDCSVLYADTAYKFGGEGEVGVMLGRLNAVSAQHCNKGVWITYGTEGSWKNGIEINPWNISGNDINIQLDKGVVTTIRGGAVEIGASTETREWMTHKYGIYTTGRAIVNIEGSIWAENLEKTVYATGDSIVNIYGETWMLKGAECTDNAVVNVYSNDVHATRIDAFTKDLSLKEVLCIDAKYNKSTDGLYNLVSYPQTPTLIKPSSITYNQIGNANGIRSCTMPLSTFVTKEFVVFYKLKMKKTANTGTDALGSITLTDTSNNKQILLANRYYNDTNQIQQYIYSGDVGSASFRVNLDKHTLKYANFTENDIYEIIVGLYIDLANNLNYVIGSDGSIFNRFETYNPYTFDSLNVDTLSLQCLNNVSIEKISIYNGKLSTMEILQAIDNIKNDRYETLPMYFAGSFTPMIRPYDEGYNGKSMTFFDKKEDGNIYRHGFIIYNPDEGESVSSTLPTGAKNGALLYLDKKANKLYAYATDRINLNQLTNVSFTLSQLQDEAVVSQLGYNGQHFWIPNFGVDVVTYNGKYKTATGDDVNISESSDYKQRGTETQIPQISVCDGQYYYITDKQQPIWYSKTLKKWCDFEGNEYNILRQGSTGERPATAKVGFQYFDTTLNKPIWKTSTGWVDATGAEV